MKQLIIISILFLFGCKNAYQFNNAEIANNFIDAFYSFNQDELEPLLSRAPESRSGILYYQKWAECGNYEIVKRHDCIFENDTTVICPVTVKDDLIGALGIDFNVTDTFQLTIINRQIRSVITSSNDPDQYFEAKDWVMQNRPDLIEVPCEGIMEDGPTPCECVRAMVKGFTEFIASY